MKRFARIFTLQACAIVFGFSHTTVAAESNAFGQSVAAQRDGKIVVAGSAQVSGVDQFALVRYNSDGSLDTSLNGSGKVTTAVGTGTRKGQGMALSPASVHPQPRTQVALLSLLARRSAKLVTCLPPTAAVATPRF